MSNMHMDGLTSELSCVTHLPKNPSSSINVLSTSFFRRARPSLLSRSSDSGCGVEGISSSGSESTRTGPSGCGGSRTRKGSSSSASSVYDINQSYEYHCKKEWMFSQTVHLTGLGYKRRN